ncbi:MAG TPA: hypothetical protein EYO73_10905, partial [Sulfurimonas sp.]|nr:hypothetical protein [Sulfurimonas sp.]
MSNENTQVQYIEEDTIDLRDLWATLMKRKGMIVGITLIITIMAIVYVLVVTPMYEAKALIQMGEYKIDNSNSNSNKVIIDNSSHLSRKLNVLYI